MDGCSERSRPGPDQMFGAGCLVGGAGSGPGAWPPGGLPSPPFPCLNRPRCCSGCCSRCFAVQRPTLRALQLGGRVQRVQPRARVGWQGKVRPLPCPLPGLRRLRRLLPGVVSLCGGDARPVLRAGREAVRVRERAGHEGAQQGMPPNRGLDPRHALAAATTDSSPRSPTAPASRARTSTAAPACLAPTNAIIARKTKVRGAQG